jgi:acetoin utilization deacetylase AcuC-like enzyme
MKIYSIDTFLFEIPEGHRFPLEKYRMLREQVVSDFVPPAEMCVPHGAEDDQILLAHTDEYLEKLKTNSLSDSEIRRIGLPWSPDLLERSRRSVGATIEASRSALDDGVAVSLSGGTHHACADHGQGFCVLNDVAVTLRVLKRENRLRRAVIIDTDVHQGNGTAEILAGEKRFFTFSIHSDKNFPARKIDGDLDVPLPDGMGDEDYIELLEQGVERAVALSSPDLIVYLAGADPFEGDRLGRLSLSKAGLRQRDKIIFDLASREKLPVAVVMSGGYGKNIQDTVDIHAATVGAALQFYLSNQAK